MPLMISHCVGGSSSRTGAKFWDKTCLGSTDGFIGGSMKVLMMSSNVLNSSAGSDDVCGFLRLWVVGGVGRVFVGGVVVVVLSVWDCDVWGFSLVLMDEMLNGGVEVVGGCLLVIMMGLGTMVMLEKEIMFWGCNCDLCEEGGMILILCWMGKKSNM